MKSPVSLPSRSARLRALAAGAAIAVAAALPATATAATPVPARSANSFVESIGVNTHTYYLDTSYNNFSLVEQRLQELGVRHIRENLVANVPYQYERLNKLAADGIHSTLILGSPENGIGGLNELISTLKNDVSNSVEAVEGPNEWDLSGGGSWMEKLAPYQQALYNDIKSSPATASLPVIGPPLGNTESVASNIAGSMDYGSIHSYPNAEPPESNLTQEFSFASRMSGSKPLVATETGYHTALAYQGGHRPISEAAEATYMPRLFLGYFNRGIARTFDYELVDEHPDPTDAEPESNFGLLHSDFSPKPAFTALSNLISILNDPGSSFTPGSLEYNVGGDTEELQQTLLQKQDGTYYLALWRSSSVWNPTTKTPEKGQSGRVELELGAPVGSVAEYMPNLSGQPVRTLRGNGNSLSVEVGPQVVILQLGGTAGASRAGRVKAWFSRNTVIAGSRVEVHARVPLPARSERVSVERWEGRWTTVAQGRASADGQFRKQLRVTAAGNSGPSRYRVIAERAQPSPPLRVKVVRPSRGAPIGVANHQAL